MNEHDLELEVLERIVLHVKRFRAEHENSRQDNYDPYLSRYLQQWLTLQDWELWEKLQTDWKDSKVVLPTVGV